MSRNSITWGPGKTQTVPTARASKSADLGQGLRSCISNRFLDDVDVVGDNTLRTSSKDDIAQWTFPIGLE